MSKQHPYNTIGDLRGALQRGVIDNLQTAIEAAECKRLHVTLEKVTFAANNLQRAIESFKRNYSPIGE